jgi:hypothetical protein
MHVIVRTPEAEIMFVSQAEFVIFTLSIPNSFLPVCPKTWLMVRGSDERFL